MLLTYLGGGLVLGAGLYRFWSSTAEGKTAFSPDASFWKTLAVILVGIVLGVLGQFLQATGP